MTEPQDKEKLTEEIIALQKKLSAGTLTDAEKKRMEEIKVQLTGGGKEAETVKFKVKSDSEKAPEKKTFPQTSDREVKEAKVIEIPEEYERRSSYSIDDIQKKIDRLDSEGTGKLRDRYKEKYGEELYVPDLHTENVREALEDVKDYIDIDHVEAEAASEDKKKDKVDADEETDEEKDTGPGFFSRLIASIKAFFVKIFSRKGKKESATKVELNDTTVAAAANGE